MADPDDDGPIGLNPTDVQVPYTGPKMTLQEMERQLLEAWADGSVPEGASVEAEWAKRSGLSPIEFLCDAYRNPYNPMKLRINAASKVMDFVHKKLAAELKLKGDPSAPLLAAAKMNVAKLSDDELLLLGSLLEKVGASQLIE